MARMKPAWSERNFTPRLFAALSANDAVPGVAVDGQIVAARATAGASARIRTRVSVSGSRKRTAWSPRNQEVRIQAERRPRGSDDVGGDLAAAPVELDGL